jgi:hypothetical protein
VSMLIGCKRQGLPKGILQMRVRMAPHGGLRARKARNTR